MNDLLGMERKTNHFRNLDQRVKELSHGGRIDSTQVCTVQVLVLFSPVLLLPYIKHEARILDDDLSLFSLYLISSLIPLRDDKILKTTNANLFSGPEAEFLRLNSFSPRYS
jgi:hypothetical protein